LALLFRLGLFLALDGQHAIGHRVIAVLLVDTRHFDRYFKGLVSLGYVHLRRDSRRKAGAEFPVRQAGVVKEIVEDPVYFTLKGAKLPTGGSERRFLSTDHLVHVALLKPVRPSPLCRASPRQGRRV